MSWVLNVILNHGHQMEYQVIVIKCNIKLWSLNGILSHDH